MSKEGPCTVAQLTIPGTLLSEIIFQSRLDVGINRLSSLKDDGKADNSNYHKAFVDFNGTGKDNDSNNQLRSPRGVKRFELLYPICQI